VRVFYDTEFYERGSKWATELLSIGAVREDGETYYAVVKDFSNLFGAFEHHDWLRTNVCPHIVPGYVLPVGSGLEHYVASLLRTDALYESTHGHSVFAPRNEIARELEMFMGLPTEREELQLWGYYGCSDHVLLSGLWERMTLAPPGFPYFTLDLAMLMRQVGFDHTSVPKPVAEHNALADALWNEELFNSIRDKFPEDSRLWLSP